MKPCLLIPIYDHADTIGRVLRSLAYVDLPCLVIDDGSNAETRDVLDRLARELPWVEVERLPANGGRGVALRHGYETAARRGFSHAAQLDADGQHDTADVPKFLEAARRAPTALVLGEPIFDDTAPKSRLYGRRLSRFWVWAETLSFAIRDPLCGFRCIPLESVVSLLRQVRLGDRMEFDPEIAVRLVWEGVPVVNVPTRVRYLSGGVSHFRPVRDNLLISWLHARLFFGMLRRLPALLRSGLGRPR